MKRREKIAAPAVGGSSLLVAFAVLCLTVFALLALTTARAEKRLSDQAAQAVADYYRADLEAERIFARLRAGESVPGVQEEQGIYRYHCPVSRNQTLWVELGRSGDCWRVIRWQTTASSEEINQNLPVWDGK